MLGPKEARVSSHLTLNLKTRRVQEVAFELKKECRHRVGPAGPAAPPASFPTQHSTSVFPVPAELFHLDSSIPSERPSRGSGSQPLLQLSMDSV